MIHLAIIPDGNRRWARERDLDPWKGHEKAIDNFRTIADALRENSSVNVLTIWCFSTENWKRDKKEVDALMREFERYVKGEREKLVKNDTRFVHSGRKDRIPKSLVKVLEETEEATKNGKTFTLHCALDYGGRDEIVRAANKIERDATEETLRAHLDHPELPDIDVVYRTSGEMRSSNFFLWQAAYAEWVYTEKYFPDITKEDITECLETYENRKRRFGA